MTVPIWQDEALLARFWAKVDQRGPDECWLWTGNIGPKGYGRFNIDGRKCGAHKVSLIIATEADPGDLFACHRCNHAWCVNPNHLYAGTPKQNAEDMVLAGTQSCGDRNGHLNPAARLTLHQVREIRSKLSEGVPRRLLAGSYGVSYGAILNIAVGRSWRNADA